MTYEEFLAKLRETPRDWRFVSDTTKAIRRSRYDCCPITAVDGYLGDAKDFMLIAEALGLPTRVAFRVAAAADNSNWHPDFSSDVRRDLLAACGLSEQE